MAEDSRDSGSALSARGKLDDAEILTALEGMVQASLDQKYTLQFSLWPKFLAYARGQQWLSEKYGTEERYWQDNKDVERTRRVTLQMIKPRQRQYVSLLMRAKPGFECMPRRDTDDARSRAQVSNFFLDWFMETTNAHEARWLATSSLSALGSGYLQPYFDAGRGRAIETPRSAVNPLSGMPIKDGFLGTVKKLFSGARPVKPKVEFEGELGVNAYTPFEVFPPAGSNVPFTHMWPYVHVADVLDEGEARRRYPKAEEDIKAGNEAQRFGLDYQGAMSSLLASAHGKQSWAAPIRQTVVVWKYYEPPSNIKGFEQGREIHWTAGQILKDGPLEIPEAGIPLHGIYGDWDPGLTFCQGLVESLTDCNDFMNRVASRILRWMMLSLDPPILAPVGSGITEESMKQGYKKVIPYDQLRGEPRWLEFPMLPTALFSLMGMLEVQADRMSGMQPLARGELTKGMPSGVLMQLIQEAQESVLSQYAQLASRSWARFGNHVLSMAKKNYTGQITVRVLGEQDSSTFLEVKPGDLGDVDVTVKEDSMLPRLKGARKAYVKESWQAGLYGSPNDPSVLQHVRRQLDEPAVLSTSVPGEADRAYAEHEDWLMLKTGVQVMPGQRDNHQIHIYQHTLKTRDIKYLDIPAPLRQMHEQHIQAHEQAQQALSQQAAAAQLDQFRQHEMVKAQASAIRTEAGMIANILSAQAAEAIRRGQGVNLGETLHALAADQQIALQQGQQNQQQQEQEPDQGDQGEAQEPPEQEGGAG